VLLRVFDIPQPGLERTKNSVFRARYLLSYLPYLPYLPSSSLPGRISYDSRISPSLIEAAGTCPLVPGGRRRARQCATVGNCGRVRLQSSNHRPTSSVARLRGRSRQAGRIRKVNRGRYSFRVLDPSDRHSFQASLLYLGAVTVDPAMV
jgi:hypothetical protein